MMDYVDCNGVVSSRPTGALSIEGFKQPNEVDDRLRVSTYGT